MQYQFFRLFLTHKGRPALLERMGRLPTVVSREDHLAYGFSRDFEFLHRKIPFAYVYVTQVKSVLIGAVGRKIVDHVHSSPEEKFAARPREGWRAANIYVNVAPEADGQKAAVAYDRRVGTPLPILRSLASQLNQVQPDSGWQIEVHPISDSTDFWVSVEHHKGAITNLDLDFVTPNIWGAKTATDQALQKIRDQNAAQHVSVSLGNDQGALEPDSEDVRESIEYISRGGGTAKLRHGGKILYNSEGKIRSADIEDDAPVAEMDRRGLLTTIYRLFGL